MSEQQKAKRRFDEALDDFVLNVESLRYEVSNHRGSAVQSRIDVLARAIARLKALHLETLGGGRCQKNVKR